MFIKLEMEFDSPRGRSFFGSVLGVRGALSHVRTIE
jgi:hypothetical protein